MQFDNFINSLLNEDLTRAQRINALKNISTTRDFKIAKYVYKVVGRPHGALTLVRSYYMDNIRSTSIESAYDLLLNQLKKELPSGTFPLEPVVNSEMDVGFLDLSNNNFHYDYLIVGSNSEYYKNDIINNEEQKNNIIDIALEE